MHPGALREILLPRLWHNVELSPPSRNVHAAMLTILFHCQVDHVLFASYSLEVKIRKCMIVLLGERVTILTIFVCSDIGEGRKEGKKELKRCGQLHVIHFVTLNLMTIPSLKHQRTVLLKQNNQKNWSGYLTQLTQQRVRNFRCHMTATGSSLT